MRRLNWEFISGNVTCNFEIPPSPNKKERKKNENNVTWSCEMQSIRHSCLSWRHTQTHEMVTVYFLSGNKERKL